LRTRRSKLRLYSLGRDVRAYTRLRRSKACEVYLQTAAQREIHATMPAQFPFEEIPMRQLFATCFRFASGMLIAPHC
jgi:hypothetical protein